MENNLNLIVFENIKELGRKVDNHLMEMYKTDKSFIIPIQEIRFSNGEGKVIINETVRGKDIYVMSDVFNHSVSYKMNGYINHKSPDDHFQDIKRFLSAKRNQPEKTTLITPSLYGARQHKRTAPESMDCAESLRELEANGVHTFVVFDAHDPSVGSNAIRSSFENFYPTNLMIDDFYNNEEIDYNNLIIVSPDDGASARANYYANLLKSEIGSCSKRRDLTKVVDGKNPIIGYEYRGKDVKGKTVIIVDDMIASGDSILEVAYNLKEMGAEKIYFFTTFTFFTEGIEKFKKAYKEKIFNKLYTTNTSYSGEEAKKEPWFNPVDCSKMIARIIYNLHEHEPLRDILNEKPKCLTKIYQNKGINY